MRNTVDSKATLKVKAYWDPIADASLDLPKHSPKHAALFNNLSPAHLSQAYDADAFKVFFPKRSAAIGDLWELDPDTVIPFLRQFHSGATAEMHINPGKEFVHEVFNFTVYRSGPGFQSEGAFACLRALSPSYAEIVFRIHAEFLLDSDTEAYFTPAQFTGHLILNRDNGTIREFRLYLPPRNTNVYINAFGEVDMVFVPRMELIGQNPNDQRDTLWDTAITEDEARAALQASFYKFTEIERPPIEEVVAQAQAKNRPIHVLLTWGVFEDESCGVNGKSLRAGPLASPKVIDLLNEQFVNLFIISRDLPELQNGTKGEQVSQLATVLATAIEHATAQGTNSSVNSFVLSPDLALIAHLPYNSMIEIPTDLQQPTGMLQSLKMHDPFDSEEKYLTFLNDALAAVKKR